MSSGQGSSEAQIDAVGIEAALAVIARGDGSGPQELDLLKQLRV